MNSKYITEIEVFSNRTDYGTMEPFLRQLKKKHGKKYKKITVDAGYESLSGRKRANQLHKAYEPRYKRKDSAVSAWNGLSSEKTLEKSQAGRLKTHLPVLDSA